MVTGKLTVDTGWGRRVRPLGPFGITVAAPAATVLDVIAAPYLGRTPRAIAGKLLVIERGTGMVLAEHYTPVHHGRFTATTLETVTFDQPHKITFRLVGGPVPYPAEEFAVTEQDGTTRLGYSGERDAIELAFWPACSGCRLRRRGARACGRARLPDTGGGRHARRLPGRGQRQPAAGAAES